MSKLILSEFSSSSCGIDCKYEDAYLLIEQEVDKEFSVTQDSTDWTYVYTQTMLLLENETKDLKLASWWLFAAWKENSWRGLELNLPIFIEFVNTFNKELFPKSVKGKANIVFWLEEVLNKEILQNEENKKSLSNHCLFYELFTNLDLEIKNLLENNENRFKKIISFLKPYYDKKQEELEEKQKEEDKKSIVEASLKTETKVQIEQELVGELSNESDVKKLLSTIKKNLSTLNKYYRNNDFRDLKAIKITRFLSWLEIDELPYAEGKKTFLYPPSELEVDEVKNLMQEENYTQALNFAEEIIEVCPFWIDGHYLVHNIFEKMNCSQNAKEIKNSLISFVKTNEGILDFYFTDDTPFCSNKVKKWINDELTTSNNSSNQEDNIQADNSLEHIYELANNDKVKEAMYEIAEKYKTAKTVEEKFNWRLNHAQLAVEFDKKDIALALLEDLQKDIDKFNLNEWNPSLASKVYTLILNTFTNIDIPYEKLEEIYKNLCKTDINSAFEINFN